MPPRRKRFLPERLGERRDLNGAPLFRLYSALYSLSSRLFSLYIFPLSQSMRLTLQSACVSSSVCRDMSELIERIRGERREHGESSARRKMRGGNLIAVDIRSAPLSVKSLEAAKTLTANFLALARSFTPPLVEAASLSASLPASLFSSDFPASLSDALCLTTYSCIPSQVTASLTSHSIKSLFLPSSLSSASLRRFSPSFQRRSPSLLLPSSSLAFFSHASYERRDELRTL